MSYSVKGECRNTGRTHFSIGYIPWNKDKKGIYSKETLEKISQGAQRKRPNQSLATKGRPWSEARRKAHKSQKGILLGKRLSTKPIIKNGKEYPWFWHELRKLIYRRDKWTCQECGVKCHNTTRRRIQCHHVDYDITNNDPKNLITLCAMCHAKTNYRREDWIKHFFDKS